MAQHLHDELERAQRSGPVRDILIPPCPELLLQLQSACAHGEPDLVEIDRIAGADVAMAAALLRQANSSLYGLVHPAQTVGRAMTVLGLKAALQLLSTFLTRRALPVNSPLLAHFWETSTRRALACEHVGAQLYDIDSGLAYTVGLFCHVGMPVMLGGVKGYGSTIVEALARRDRSFTQTENANHRTDHAVVGAIVARTWRLPPEVALTVRLHHDFTCLKDERVSALVRRLVALTLIADYLVLQYEGVNVPADWARYGSACLEHLQIGPDELEHWIDTLHPVFEQQVQF